MKHFLDLDGTESAAETQRAFREYEGQRRSLERYFKAMQEMLSQEKKGDLEAALELAGKQISELPKWTAMFIAAYRKLDVGFPCISLGVRYFPVFARLGDANSLTQQVAQVPELSERYRYLVEQMEVDFSLSERLKEFLRKSPDSKQNQIGKLAGLPARDVARLLKTMEKAGIVHRKKNGKTHIVKLMEPLAR